jgi:hypothetical protein
MATTNITLTWSYGVLQSATNVMGPWTDVSEASSPYTNTADQPYQFYRLWVP